MCNVHVSVQNGLENTNYSRYFRQEGIYYRKLEAYRIMGRAMRAKVRETTTQVQEIRMYKHHKQLNRGSITWLRPPCFLSWVSFDLLIAGKGC